MRWASARTRASRRLASTACWLGAGSHHTARMVARSDARGGEPRAYRLSKRAHGRGGDAMSLPVLDRESYQHTASEWVVQVGNALKEAGYLQAEPTGMYDEEFTAALTAFQEAHGINEENMVGPYTWAALGIDETGFGQSHDEHAGYDQTDQVSQVGQVGQLSDDGQWQWDGAQWLPAVAAGPTAAAFASAATTTTADASHSEDTELASSIIDYELEILVQWKAALDSFNEVMESDTEKSAKADFNKALFKIFSEKVLGAFAKDAKATLVIDVLKGLVGEAERARKAQQSVAFRDFYTTHQTEIANVHKELVLKKRGFVTGVRQEVERMLRNDPNAYGMLRMELMELHQDAEQRLREATQEALFSELSAEWIKLGVAFSRPAAVQGEIRVRVNESDLSVLGVDIKAPDGDKLLEQLTRQPGGMDVWNMHVPKVIIYMHPTKGNDGTVRLDANNRLANLPAEQDGKYRQRYDRLIAQGGLAPVTRR
ncbi:MAG TPA: peptidoglycan-binding domain-containing protein [Actinophytocola sp.]|uniref:peptidoglycan-binding domain-containing protein n=1 Tax=Actinophytocola sp. TaxID=1872138 RepID=UPI002DBDF810|nr:peptidoglycan-binding domain-containing protein [Actinophytocola sp.]HEU5470994.1 peptidoglycan-binding domain-containing protein [Actinophytocola sp.]